ncbi:MAG: galactokinase [Myxococcota bacterium]|nr:galactokinase [Myxococcota bacterium]
MEVNERESRFMQRGALDQDEAAALLERARAGFQTRFGGIADGIAFAPGRVNLIGEHTDYNDGLALPFALRCGTAVAFRRDPAANDELIVIAGDLDSAEDQLTLSSAPIPLGEESWARYHRGVAEALGISRERVGRLELWICGDLPRGAGLSSSASLCLAVGLALELARGQDVDPIKLSLAAQRAEIDYLGTRCGLLDQLAISLSTPGHATLLDCAIQSGEPIPIRPGMIEFALVDSGIRRGLVESAYNERRSQCEAAAEALSLKRLRGLSIDELDNQRSQLTALLYRRARHVFSENLRTRAAAEALEAGDLATLGALLRETQRSLSEDFEVSLPKIDALAAAIDREIGELGGARMIGGGFGGALIVAGSPGVEDRLRARLDILAAESGCHPRLLPCEAGAGMRAFRL